MARGCAILLLVCLAAGASFADGEAAADDAPPGANDARRGMLLSLGLGLSKGRVELSDGTDSISGGEFGFAVNGDLGYHLNPHWALSLSFRSFSQTDQGLFDFLPTLCAVIGPAATWFLRPAPRSPFVTFGLGHPFDGLDSVNAPGVLGAFLGAGYEFGRLRAVLTVPAGLYDGGVTFAITLTANLVLR